MAKKHKVYIDADSGLLVIDGIKYVQSVDRLKKIDGITHVEKKLFMEFDEDEHKKKCEFILKKILDEVPKEKLLKEILLKQPSAEINKIYKKIKGNAKPKLQEGCLGLNVDGIYLPLIDGFA
jgi:hypothetical protein